jgi:hypothetical protein
MNNSITQKMPEFLRRKSEPLDILILKWRKERLCREAQHPGANIKMPAYRFDPRRDQLAEKRRSDPRVKDATNKKVQHPPTEALKEATIKFSGSAKRKVLYDIAVENGIMPQKWNHLNIGQVAMNLGNTLRGRYYRMQKVTINGKEVM